MGVYISAKDAIKYSCSCYLDLGPFWVQWKWNIVGRIATCKYRQLCRVFASTTACKLQEKDFYKGIQQNHSWDVNMVSVWIQRTCLCPRRHIVATWWRMPFSIWPGYMGAWDPYYFLYKSRHLHRHTFLSSAVDRQGALVLGTAVSSWDSEENKHLQSVRIARQHGFHPPTLPVKLIRSPPFKLPALYRGWLC